MPYSSNSGGGDGKSPWGPNKPQNNPSGGDKDNGNPWGAGGKRPNEGQKGQYPSADDDIERMIREGQDRLRKLFGGGSGGNGGNSGRTGRGAFRGLLGLFLLAFLAYWVFQSVYIVRDPQQAVELRFGKYVETTGPGLHFAPWPFYTREILNVQTENSELIGKGMDTNGREKGLMLTSDENIVDIDFEVIWNIKNAHDYKFNIAAPVETVNAVAESAMREIVAQSRLIPLLNTERDTMPVQVRDLIQKTLDEYASGINVKRVNLLKVEAPEEVIAAFLDVQAAEQERDKLEQDARATANKKLADARGKRAQLLEDAEGYRARVVNEAEGDASRFLAVLEEYEKAEDVTRRRLYLETIEEVYGNVNKIIIDESAEGGSGVVPYLPLNELQRGTNSGGNSTQGASQ